MMSDLKLKFGGMITSSDPPKFMYYRVTEMKWLPHQWEIGKNHERDWTLLKT